MSEKKQISAFRAAFPYTIPVMAGYVFLGITYGILMRTSGFSFWYPMVTSLIIYTGSMEFLTVSILLSSFNPASAFATAVMVGARHLFYGISLLRTYRHMGWRKFYLIYATSDETFSIVYTTPVPEGVVAGDFYMWISFLDQMYWFAGATIGGLFGGLLRFNTEGLDFVMTAMFIVILLNQWLKDGTSVRTAARDHIPELTGIFGSLVCLLIFGPDHFIIPAMAVILVVLTLMRPVLDPVWYRQKKAIPAAPRDENDEREEKK